MEKFKGMNIFLVAPFFYGYELEIKKALMQNGLNVTSYFFIGFQKTLLKFWKNKNRYLFNIKKEILILANSKIFDYLLVVNTSFIDNRILHTLRDKNKAVKTIIYLWDTVENLNWLHFEDYLSNFDFRYSFDRLDCMKHSNINLKHRPNFYHPMIDIIDRIQTPKYDIASVMSAQPNRIRLINDLDTKTPDLKKAFHVHLLRLKSIPAYWLNHGVVIKPKHIKLNRLSIKQSIKLFNNSKSVLDIPANNQHGLPFRTLDSIGLHKKIITTNNDVFNYDFYHPDNVLIIQSGKVEAVKYFLSVPYKPLEESIRKKYSLDFWIKSVLNNESINYLKIIK